MKFAAKVKSKSPPNSSVFQVAIISIPVVSVSAPFKKNCPPPAPEAVKAAFKAGDKP